LDNYLKHFSFQRINVCSALGAILAFIRYINLCFTHLLTYLHHAIWRGHACIHPNCNNNKIEEIRLQCNSINGSIASQPRTWRHGPHTVKQLPGNCSAQ